MVSHRIAIYVAVMFGLAASVGCGSSSSSSPTAPSAPAATTLNLAGTWSGNIRVAGESDATAIRSWALAQTGASVTGPVVVIADEDNGVPVTVTGTMSGTLSGSQITQATFTIPVGAIPDHELAACGFSGTGTLTASASSISGPLTMTFPAACVGEERVSETATATWTFTFTK